MSGLTADAVDAHTKNARGLSDLVDVASSNSSSSRSSHRYLGEKKCKLCKKTSTAPNVISKGPFSVNEYIIWNSSSQGLQAECLWCAVCYGVFTHGGFLEEYKEVEAFISACKGNRQLREEYDAAAKSMILDIENNGKLRMSKGRVTSRVEALKSARRQIVDSYTRNEFQINERMKGVNEERYKFLYNKSFEEAGVATFIGEMDGKMQELTAVKTMPTGECELNILHAQGITNRTIHDDGKNRLRLGQADQKEKFLKDQQLGGILELASKAEYVEPTVSGGGLDAALAALGMTPVGDTTTGPAQDAEQEELEEQEDDFSTALQQVASIATKRTTVATKTAPKAAAKAAAKFGSATARAQFLAPPMLRATGAQTAQWVTSTLAATPAPRVAEGPDASNAVSAAKRASSPQAALVKPEDDDPDAETQQLEDLKASLGYNALWEPFKAFVTKSCNIEPFTSLTLEYSDEFISKLERLKEGANKQQKLVVALDIKTAKRTTLPKTWTAAMKAFRRLTEAVVMLAKQSQNSISGKAYSFEKCKVAIEDLENASLPVPLFFHVRCVMELAEDLVRCGRTTDFLDHATNGAGDLWDADGNKRMFHVVLSENLPKLIRGIKEDTAESRATVTNFAVFIKSCVEHEHKDAWLTGSDQTELKQLNNGLSGVLVGKDEVTESTPDFAENFTILLDEIEKGRVEGGSICSAVYEGSSWKLVSEIIIAMTPTATKSVRRILVESEREWHKLDERTLKGFTQGAMDQQLLRRDNACKLLLEQPSAENLGVIVRYLESFVGHLGGVVLAHGAALLSRCIIHVWEGKPRLAPKSLTEESTLNVFKFLNGLSAEQDVILRAAQSFIIEPCALGKKSSPALLTLLNGDKLKPAIDKCIVPMQSLVAYQPWPMQSLVPKQ